MDLDVIIIEKVFPEPWLVMIGKEKAAKVSLLLKRKSFGKWIVSTSWED